MDVSDFNLRHLRLLAACVREGSLGAAAEASDVSQAAVNQAITRLEELIGTALLDRTRPGATPTDAGILMAARAELATAAMAKAYRPIRDYGNGGRAGAEAFVTMPQLQALVALEEQGSYAAAAAALQAGEAAVQDAIEDLEHVSGIALVEPIDSRGVRGIIVTEAGRRTAAAFRLAVAELRAGLDELAVLEGRDQGSIRLAATPAALASLVPRAIARFLKEHPPVRFEVVEAHGLAMVEPLLRDGTLDAALLPAQASANGELTQEPVADDQLCVVGRAGHDLARGFVPGALRLAGYQWALPPGGSPERDAFERLFLDNGLFPPDVAVTSDSLAARLAMLMDSNMLTILSTHQLAPGLTAIGDPLAGSMGRLAIHTRAGWFPTPAQAAFLEELRGATVKTLDF